MGLVDAHGNAILDNLAGEPTGELILHTSYGPPEAMPIEVYLREPEDFTEIEKLALSSCQGNVLDVGAGAGSHVLALQEMGFDVAGLDMSHGCCKAMFLRGVKKILEGDFWHYNEDHDTLLLLMNGLGLIGRLDQLPRFMRHAAQIIQPGGRIIFDSSDIRYLYEEEGVPYPSGYYGEIAFRFEYQKMKSEWFDWLYVDKDTLRREIEQLGYHIHFPITDSNEQYLGIIEGF